MARQKRASEQGATGANALDRLRLRVSAMINSPKAQAECRAAIWRLDSDTDQAWRQVLEELAETDGLEMTENEDGTVTLQWEVSADDRSVGEEAETEPDMIVQRRHEEPAPF
ncbi:DUF1654 domain-containing protein [Pseudomonas nitroreducens]|uniref:DUF1654 domain-containing protein n=1 Tax=Pseudomonas nitroreducens TaxID=46680 RepID=A0ABS0KVL9_PSENT|nr:DUF1654 domain-containing protein [Pseudomonas nitroreducens]MBG6292073.1 DUF1654 domain-containing protein [Pseudomonas nitroreducens]